ncbi:phosphoenolpyruvate--protein phosphotransferase [Geoalkalibacter ferrihydriticus]|uniref:Phosphoenolpyruvate-protein phosphotransferase n=2 Tax=Geoalkalibacter ferrihydriticus TaxID=392333 RepID=A0A0C2HHW0_9BACT|nr:phosphoenolpyruvate--protein phosphotransferase [Geoalkalibacter ferrihydriticus]KIH76581.1 phosphoenolpyruvate-protein phosphotransferase [Geoalkalibacter ferrihydriticus DSM 17813]SDM02332.1 phosphoenolpyruvate--protein phosphotransferase [Geoalkalibacter ferrihydriticus]
MTDSEKSNLPPDTFLVGLGVSPGIAIGKAFLFNRARQNLVDCYVPPELVPGEVQRFRTALKESARQLQDVKERVSSPELREHLYIIDTHLLILEDDMLVRDTINQIEGEKLNAESALRRTLDKFREFFNSIEDEYLRDRRSDIDSVGERLLRNLLGEGQRSMSEIEEKAVVVAHQLSPADTMQMDRDKVIGFVTDVGGRTSHTAILARSLEIPAVVGLDNISSLIRQETSMIIDGNAGTVILNPSAETFKEYLNKKQAYEYLEKELEVYRELPAQTLDGHRLILRGNVELAREVPAVLAHGGAGVGLFRSEFLFLNPGQAPGEDEQFEIYRELAQKMIPEPVTIRTLDVGGDKFVPEINLSEEDNPAMGLRGVRFSLKEHNLLMTQLRAILRASSFGEVRVMFPMISGVDEIRACKDLLRQACAQLDERNQSYDADIKIGIMIETPSAALIADLLAPEVDFFSVGTNDLIQYCLAVDRGNEHVAYLYEPLHPAILRALKMIGDAGRKADIEVGMCGEMAGEPVYALILLGLGFNELSMNAACIPRMKRIIRQVRRQDGEELLAQLLDLPRARDVSRFVEEEMARRFPGLFGPPEI